MTNNMYGVYQFNVCIYFLCIRIYYIYICIKDRQRLVLESSQILVPGLRDSAENGLRFTSLAGFELADVHTTSDPVQLLYLWSCAHPV